MKQAVIAAEDRNFYSHAGVDVRGTLRALVTDVRRGPLAQGGSTITQQLARNAYGVGTATAPCRKIREAVLASQLDRSLTKEQILFEYLSIVYFGEGAYGIGAAAQTSTSASRQRPRPVRGRDAGRAHPGTVPLQPASRSRHGRDPPQEPCSTPWPTRA